MAPFSEFHALFSRVSKGLVGPMRVESLKNERDGHVGYEEIFYFLRDAVSKKSDFARRAGPCKNGLWDVRPRRSAAL